MLQTRRCRHCNKPFVRDISQSTARYRKFCSRPCFFAHRDGTPIDRFWSKVHKTTDGCWTWTGRLLANGYGSLSVDNKSIYAHRFSFALHFGPIPHGRFVCHHCDNPPCVRPDHLYAGTVQDNARDAVDRGLTAPPTRRPGSANGFARLTEADAQKIRMLAGRMTYGQIATLFNVNQSTVGLIIRRRTWTHI